MKNNKSNTCRMLVSGLFLAMSCHALAQGENAQGSTGQASPQVSSESSAETQKTVALSDKIHQISQTLDSVSAVHHYSFTALRGQNVLLTTPGSHYNKLWTVDYQVDDGAWTPKRFSGAERISGLKSGAQVKVRVRAVDGVGFEKAEYKIVFGSFPHMSYDLHNEKGILEISAIQKNREGFFATQGFKEATLEASFTDSKAYPLEGGLLGFVLTTGSGEVVPRVFESDKHGRIATLIEFKRCEGGWLADDVYENVEKARHTWSTRYQVGHYSAENMLPAQLADNVHKFNFAHLCKRWLTNWSRRP